MDLKFYIPLKEKTISPYNRARAEISIPAKLLENIMTNRQKKINNKSFDKARKNININSNCILSESTSNLKSHMLLSKLHYSNKKNIISKKELITKEYLLEENKKLKKENEELKKQVNPNEVQSSDINNEEEENEQKEEEQKEENEIDEETPAKETNTPSIPQDLSLFSITRNYLLCFNLKQRKFISVDPKGYDVFYQSYTPNGSISYNTLSGLFVLSGPNFDTLYYYSSKNNSIVKYFTFKFNHQNGIIFLDTSSKYLLAVSGTNTNKVERLCFETQVIDELPSLNATRGEASCCLVNDVVYVFFGYSPEKKKCLDSVEYLDMKNMEEGWKLIELNEKQFELKGVSVARLGAREMIIVGGENGKGEANKNMIYFNVDEKKMTKLEKTLPEGNKKKEYLFKKNSMFNFFAEGDTICYANIDDDNCVHVIDNNLKYELFVL